MHYHRMNILVRLILYRMKKQRNFENAEMLSHISDHNDIGMSGKTGGEGGACLSLRPPKNEGLATPLVIGVIAVKAL